MKYFNLLLMVIFCSTTNAQLDSAFSEMSKVLFNSRGLNKGFHLKYNVATYTHRREFDYFPLFYKIESIEQVRRYYYLYKDDAWHSDGFVYEINLNDLQNSEYFFFDKDLDTTIGYFTTDTAYVVKKIENSKLIFVDSLSVKVNDAHYSIYKFKTLHTVQDSNDVCMLHFISPQIGLITRQSSIWWCISKSWLPESFEEGYCAFEDRNHFSFLNVSDQYVESIKFGKKVKEERPNWIFRALRTGAPVDSTILSFYNDTNACQCSYDALFRGYYEYLERKAPNQGLTRKQIRKIGRKDKRYYRWYERMERKGRVDEEGNVIQ